MKIHYSVSRENEVDMKLPISSYAPIFNMTYTSSSKQCWLGSRISFSFGSCCILDSISPISCFSFLPQFSSGYHSLFLNSRNWLSRSSLLSPLVKTNVTDLLIDSMSVKYFDILLIIRTKPEYHRSPKLFFDRTMRIRPLLKVFSNLTVPMLLMMSI